MPNFKMTYPYPRTFIAGLGTVEPDEVITADENPDANFFEETADPVGKPEMDAEVAPGPAAAAPPPAIPAASPLAAPAAEAAPIEEPQS